MPCPQKTEHDKRRHAHKQLMISGARWTESGQTVRVFKKIVNCLEELTESPQEQTQRHDIGDQETTCNSSNRNCMQPAHNSAIPAKDALVTASEGTKRRECSSPQLIGHTDN